MKQVDRRNSIRAENVSNNLNHEVVVEIPYDREEVKSSINKGESLLLDRKTHPMTLPLLELVSHVKERVMVVEEV